MKFVSCLLAIGVLAGGVVRGAAELVNGVRAVVDDSVITYQEVNSLDEQLAERLMSQYRSDPATLDKKFNEMRRENLDSLVERQLILHEFKKAGYNLPESVIDDLVQENIRSKYRDRATATMTLQSQGLTYEKLRQRIKEQFIVQQMRLKNVSSEIIISPHKMESYYVAHRDEFKVEDEVKLRVIVLKPSEQTDAAATCQLAEEIRGRLQDGAPFTELASMYSQGSQRNQGGDWGWWERSQLTKGLADVAFSLPKGKCSQVFSRTFGDDYWVYQYEDGRPTVARHYGVDPDTNKQKIVEERRLEGVEPMAKLPPPQEFYLLQVDDLRTAHFKPLNEVRDSIEKTLTSEERKRLENQWIERLKKKTFVVSF
jgi:peptidyl-prolyl cis-trans isomerase SurA